MVDDLAERGTPEFYREQAVRLTKLAAETASHANRLELLEIASVFQKLADHTTANMNNVARRLAAIDDGSA